MTPQQYELLAEALRFIFVPLFLFILYRTARNAWAEYRIEKLETGDVGATGVIMGYYAMIDDWQDDDAWKPLYEDNVAGSGIGCNVRIKNFGLRGRHARLYFDDGMMYIERLCKDGDRLTVNGLPLVDKSEVPDGSRIAMGDTEILVTFRGRRAVPDAK